MSEYDPTTMSSENEADADSSRPMTDAVTGWCDRGSHQWCFGTLTAGTGHHWWCVCSCHPEPTAAAASPSADPDDVTAALDAYHRARADREAGQP